MLCVFSVLSNYSIYLLKFWFVRRLLFFNWKLAWISVVLSWLYWWHFWVMILFINVLEDIPDGLQDVNPCLSNSSYCSDRSAISFIQASIHVSFIIFLSCSTLTILDSWIMLNTYQIILLGLDPCCAMPVALPVNIRSTWLFVDCCLICKGISRLFGRRVFFIQSYRSISKLL